MSDDLYEVPIVVIGASALGLALIDELTTLKNHVVVIDKAHGTDERVSAVLRNQHTLQSGVLQVLRKPSDEFADNKELLQGYSDIAKRYREIIREYKAIKIYSETDGILEINLPPPSQEEDTAIGPINRFKANVRALGHGEIHRQPITNRQTLKRLETELGDFHSDTDNERVFFHLPDRTIDYDKLLALQKAELIVKGEQNGSKAIFIPKSEKIEVEETKEGKYLVHTDSATFKSTYVYVAAGLGTQNVLQKILPKGDGSYSYGYLLLKSKKGKICSLYKSSYAKLEESKRDGSGAFNLLYVAKHGNNGVLDPEFLVIGNGRSFTVESKVGDIPSVEKKYRRDIKIKKKQLKESLNRAVEFKDHDIDYFNLCVLKCKEQKYLPTVCTAKKNLIAAHSGLTSTAKSVAKKVIKSMARSNGSKSIRNHKIDKTNLRQLEILSHNQRKSILKNATLLKTVRRNEMTDDKAWFRNHNKT